jgi:hypothetical protein
MKATHRHTNGPEHDYEPVHGLPELLPAGERLLWQGAPDWRVLARHAFHVRKLAVYFAAMLALRVVFVIADGGGSAAALRSIAVLTPVALLGLGLVLLLAWLSARGTAYTLTDRRVVMRIGIVLTVTYNLPYKRIVSADLRPLRQDHGDIALALKDGDRIGWLHLWPHARPWQLARPQPMLRALPQAAEVATLLTQAWSAATGLGVTPAAAPAPRPNGLQPSPALATR